MSEVAVATRKTCLEVCRKCGGGHLGSSLSAVEILTYLYMKKLRVTPENASDASRDKFVLSKGHAGLALCSLFAVLKYIDKSELQEFNGFDAPVSIHLDERKQPLVDVSTGSLGHGEGVALGMALGHRIKGFDGKIYALLGDGELNEGSTMEAFAAVNAFNAKNLVTIIDYNGFMLDGRATEVFDFEPVKAKLEAFGFETVCCDGHDFYDLDKAFSFADCAKRPCAILAKTTKGKGVSFMENNVSWHYGSPTEKQFAAAMEELDNV